MVLFSCQHTFSLLLTYLRDSDKAELCVNSCMQLEAECFAACEGDMTCFNTCVLEFDICRNSCPCYENCPDGCDGCSSSFCTCSNLETNKEFQHCSHIHDSEFHICLAACHPDDTDCFSSCSRKYDEAIKHCPCQVFNFK